MSSKISAITVPKWGIEMREGTVTGWHVKESCEVNRGDELIDVETDKIVNTMEAPSSGILYRCLAAEGEVLQVGALLGVIGPAGLSDSEIDAFIASFQPTTISYSPEVPSETNEKPANADAAPARQPEPASSATGGRIRVSPATALRARELGVDISLVTAAGRRLTPLDVERYAQQQKDSAAALPATVAYESIPLSATRKAIARKLTEAKQQIPHFYLSRDIHMDAALHRRSQMNLASNEKISLNDLVMRAVVLALQSLPDLNIHLVQDEIHRFSHVNLAMAVATDRGIITPVIAAAEKLTLAELSQQAAKLGALARDGGLQRGQLEDGTFTVSNLGMFGINEFQAIINPPQGAILALGVCEKRLVPSGDGFASASIMRVTLSCDHRAIDGAVGAGFLAKLKNLLEQPEKL